MVKCCTILLTGATGLIGGELIGRLGRAGAERILCLIRPKGHTDVGDRLRDRLRRSAGPLAAASLERTEALAGDVVAPGFGLSADDDARVRDSVDIIIHSAAELSFTRDVLCRKTNITGMHHLIDLARRCRRNPRVVYISTATVCGAVSHRCMTEEAAGDPESDHHNEYTRSKAVAEQLLRESGLPHLILRPSVVLSAGVPSRKFARAIAWFVPLLCEFEAIPIDPASRVDVVPVWYVVDAIVKLLARERLAHSCYNLSAGPADSMVCGRMGAFLDRFYERRTPLRLVPPREWTREMHRQHVRTPQQRKSFSTLRYYLPFINMDVVYANDRLRTELGDDVTRIPPVAEYMGELLSRIGAGDPARRAATA